MMRPVGVTAILVNEHIVDERRNIKQGVKLLIVMVISSLGNDAAHFLPCFQIAFSRLNMIAAVLFNLDDIDIALRATKMIFPELAVHTLRNIIDAPVNAVQEHMHIESIHTRAPQPTLHTAGPHITCILRLSSVSAVPMLPGIAEMTAKHQLVELSRLAGAIKRVFKCLLSVLFLEYQTEGMLGILLCQPSMTAMQTDTTSSTEVVLLGTAHEFETCRTCPYMSRGIAHRRAGEDVDATGIRI